MLVAYDAKSRKKLWELPVYHNPATPGLETDVQDLFFKSITLGSDQQHPLIEREHGGTYLVDPATNRVMKTD